MDIGSLVRFYSEIGNAAFRKYIELNRPILDVVHFITDKIFYVFLFLAILFSTFYLIMSVYVSIRKKRKGEKRFIPEKAPKVTIQIPTYNELAAIRCAKKCLEFDYPKEKFEIIIGDDSNRKDVSQKIDSFAKQHDNVKITRRGKNIGFKPGNLNHMLKSTNGDIVIVFDSDFVPARDFLRRIVTPFIHDSSISAVQARWAFIDQNRNFVSLLGSTIATVFHYICIPFTSNVAKIAFLCGSAEAVKKKDLVELGGWKSGSFTEDIEFSLRLLKNNKKIVYLEGLECPGEVPYTAKDLYKQQMRWAYGVISSFREHFGSILLNKKISMNKKINIGVLCSGYAFSVLLLLMFIFGGISFITYPPGPLDLSRFLLETIRNIILTSGIIFASIFAVIHAKNTRKLLQTAVASFSVGLAVTYFVNVGIFKVFLGRPMQWFMLKKEGNTAES